MNVVDTKDLNTGNEKRIEIRCSEQTKSEIGVVMARMDPEMSYEELLHAVVRLHRNTPDQLEKHHY